MAGLPEITMAGTLTADPELAHTDKGIAYARFTVDANEVAASLRWAHVQVRKPDRAGTRAAGPTAPDEPPF